MAQALWTRDEWIVALAFYHRHRGNVPSKTSAEIKQLSDVLRRLREEIFKNISKEEQKKFRNPNGVYLQVMALAGLDPEHSGKGISNVAQLARAVWEDYGGQTDQASNLAKLILDAPKAKDKEPVIEKPDGMDYAPEGRILSHRHWTRERNSKIVKDKKRDFLDRYKDIFCEVCDFNYRKTYGERGDGYIECHHIKPLSELGAHTRPRLDDLILICASCHRIIHRKKPWLEPQDVKTLLSSGPYI